MTTVIVIVSKRCQIWSCNV